MSTSEIASKAFHRKRYGEEPEVDGVTFEHGSLYSNALNWYNAIKEPSDAKSYLISFFSDTPDIAQQLARVPDKWINCTAGWIARLLSRGASLPESSYEFFQKKIEQMLERVGDAPDEDSTNSVPKLSVQDHIRHKASDLIGEIEGMIDDGLDPEWSLYDHLTAGSYSSNVVGHLVRHLNPIVEELLGVLAGDDKEGYEQYSEDELIEIAAIYKTLLDEAEQYCSGTKTARAPRKRKLITAAKLLKTFKYAVEDSEFRLKSINPEKIIGATELWTFNTRYKVLTVYRAADEGIGLSVKGTSIDKYDEKTSIAKRIGRKTEERLKEVQTGGKITLRKLMDMINGDAIPVSRINNNTILLRVIRS